MSSIPDSHDDSYARFLRALADEGRQLKERSLSSVVLLREAIWVLSILALPVIWWFWQDLGAGNAPFGSGIVLLILVVLAPLLSMFQKRAKWPRERQLIYAHMRERIFARGEMRSYLAGQGLSVQPTPEGLEAFLRFFIESSNLRGQGYRYLGRSEDSPLLVRAVLLQVVADELLQGLSLFSDDADETPVLRDVPQQLQRPGWQPPSEAELQALLAKVLGAGADSALSNGIIAAFSVLLITLVVGFLQLEDGAFVTNLPWLLPLGGGLAYFAFAIVRQLPEARPMRRVTAQADELEWDIFHNGLLRDYIAVNRGKHWEAQLRGFARSYAHSRPETGDNLTLAARTELDVIEIVLEGLLQRLRESPQEFEDW